MEVDLLDVAHPQAELQEIRLIQARIREAKRAELLETSQLHDATRFSHIGIFDTHGASADRLITQAGTQRVGLLDLAGVSFAAGSEARLLRHPLVFASLRVLIVNPTVELLAVAASLPSLRRLILVASKSPATAVSSSSPTWAIAPLAAAPALRYLSLGAYRERDAPE